MSGFFVTEIECLMEQGKSLAEACSIVGVSIEEYEEGKKATYKDEDEEADELIKVSQIDAIKTLREIAQTSENDSARVRACEVITNLRLAKRNENSKGDIGALLLKAASIKRPLIELINI